MRNTPTPKCKRRSWTTHFRWTWWRPWHDWGGCKIIQCGEPQHFLESNTAEVFGGNNFHGKLVLKSTRASVDVTNLSSSGQYSSSELSSLFLFPYDERIDEVMTSCILGAGFSSNELTRTPALCSRHSNTATGSVRKINLLVAKKVSAVKQDNEVYSVGTLPAPPSPVKCHRSRVAMSINWKLSRISNFACGCVTC